MNKANEKGIVDYNILNLFEYGNSPHYKIDDYPFGGGDGMVLKPEPIFRAIDKLKVAINSDNMRVVFPTPFLPITQVMVPFRAEKSKSQSALLWP